MGKIFPFIMLFGSGLAALAYQVVWMREFRLVFGASTAATAAVSALFMAGLGIGGWLLGPKADQSRRPLMLYGKLELAIALLAAISPWLMNFCRGYYLQTGGTEVLGFWGATGARLVLAAIVLGIPTFLMGGTLPSAVRAITAESDGTRKGLGMLYGVNTLGALTGTLLTNFWLMETCGARKTLYIAVILNLLVAVLAIALGRRQNIEETPVPLESPEERFVTVTEDTGQSDTSPTLPSLLVLITAAGVGFAFFLMELVWYRMLAPMLGGSTYTFGLILAVALAGIGSGGAAYPVLVGKRRVTAGMLAVTCLLEALATMLPYAAGDSLAMIAVQISPMAALGFAGQLGMWTLICLFVVFPAAFISGVQFPLLIALLGRGSKNIGGQTGRAYALNTAGAIAGSLAGGFGLMPWLSATGCWLFCGGLLCFLGILIGLQAWRTAPASVAGQSQLAALAGLVALALLVPTFLATGPTAAWRHNPIGAGRAPAGETKNDILASMGERRLNIAWEAEGVESSVAIDNTMGYTFFINGKSDGSVFADRGTQIMFALIGAALHPEPKNSLVVGLGTGCTAGWLSAVAGMEQVDVVELEPAILEMARRCAPANYDVVKRSESGQGVNIIINDAREVLSTIPVQYDLIISEPSNPYRAGIASLFTVEFYEGVKNRLAPGGYFLTWCQAYEIDATTATTIMATLRTVFPHVECWFTQSNDLVFLCSLQAVRPDVPALKARLEEETFRDAMRIAWRKEGFEGFVSHFLARSSFVDEVVARHRRGVNTDDLTLVEYDYARTVGSPTSFGMPVVMEAARARKMSLPEWLPPDTDIELVVDNFFLTWPLADNAPSASPIESLQQRLQALDFWQQGNFNAVLSMRGLTRKHRIEFLALAESQATTGNREALKTAEKFADWWPACAAFVRARLAVSEGNVEKAVGELENGIAELRKSPWEVQATVSRAIDLIGAIGRIRPDLATRMFTLIEEPLPMDFMELHRKTTLLNIAYGMDAKKQEEVLQKWFEPNPVWEGTFLVNRVRCYLDTRNPRLGRATLDLEEYNRNTAPTLERLLEEN